MKQFITAIVAMTISVPAFATNYFIQDHYRDVSNSVPVTETVCEEKQIPLRENSFSAGKAVLGGIVGGIIGHNIGGTSNRAATTSIGALAGSMIGGSETHAVGTRTQTDCRNVTRYHEQTQSVYSHSTITFTEGGRTFTARFQK